MKKGLLLVIAMIMAVALFIPNVMAEGNVAKIGTNEYATLAAAVTNATDGDTITLISDVTISDELKIAKEVIIDLAGNNIYIEDSKAGDRLVVEGGNLTVTGEGTIEELKPWYGAIMVYGSTDKSVSANYSTVTVEKDVTLKGYSGVFVNQKSNKAYGVTVYVDGTIISVKDTSDSVGYGIYVNGSIKDTENYPAIILDANSSINSEGVGIYAAGYAHWLIDGASITGVESGLAIKSGIFEIYNATITATGEDKTPTAGYGNGINASGAAIQVESNTGYAGNVDITIDLGSTITSEKGIAFYEYLDSKTTSTLVDNVNIIDGVFTSGEEKPVFAVSESYTNSNVTTITSGVFSGEVPSNFVDADSIRFTIVAELEGETATEVTVIPSGVTIDEERFKEYVEDVLIGTGYEIKGYYLDKDYTKAFDFDKEINEDTTMYIKIAEVSTASTASATVEELPPKTSDINIILLVSTILISGIGVAIAAKKRFAKNV